MIGFLIKLLWNGGRAHIRVFCQYLVLCIIAKINHHEMEIYLETFGEEDLLIAMILILHVFYIYNFLKFLE